MKRELHRTVSRQAANGQWVARCSCGWSSRPAETEEAAIDEETDHVVAITRGE